MFCAKCGKVTFGNEELCEECKANANSAEAVKASESDTNKTNVTMLSFGKALASIIMGFGVFIISNVLNSTGARMNLAAMICMLIIDVAVTVLAIVFGAKAIHTYSTFKSGAKKPLPAFILGIIGVILAGIATVIILVFLCVELPEIAAALQ